MGISLGDLGLAYQALKVCLSLEPAHAEALNNIGVLELKRQKMEVVRACISSSKEAGPHLYEPWYNSGIHSLTSYMYTYVTQYLLHYYAYKRPNLYIKYGTHHVIYITYLYTTALIHYRAGEFQEAHSDAKKALAIYPGHVESKELMQLLAGVFTLS